MKNLLHRLLGWLSSSFPSDETLELSHEAQKAREQLRHDMDAKRANREAVEKRGVQPAPFEMCSGDDA